MLRWVLGTLAVVVVLSIAEPEVRADEPWTLEKMVTRNAKGERVFHALPVDERFENPAPQGYEDEFQKRAGRIVDAQDAVKANAGNTYFENEKRSYGYLMAHAIGSKGQTAVDDLQREDAQAGDWHKETAGIDYYAAFTLKHQMRKYFYFGDLLKPEYRQRMFDGAKSWTAKDPMRRPHHTYVPGQTQGWGPDVKNSWVDVRSTENLFLMRVTSVYLMAEETGNKQVTEAYKQLLLQYTATLYRIGIGEWDSENYHGHSIAPLCNLYDFAKDEDVKLAAKACLDFFAAAGAVKYYRGGFNGPTKRDYNHPQPFGGSAPGMLWVWFGDAPRDNTHFESDEVHMITSAYRPPQAVVDLAHKNFPRPVTILASKPHYAATTSLDVTSPPEYLETQYIANTYQMGSLPSGTSAGASDVNGFKILAWDESLGAVALQGVPGPDANFPGSPLYQEGKVSAENRVAQQENLAIWLVEDGSSPWRWVVPDTAKITERQGVTFLEFDRTWVAMRPLGTTRLAIDEAATKQITEEKKGRFPGHRVLAATGEAEGYCGVAFEVGEAQSHGSFDKFIEAVLAAEVDTSELAQGIAKYKSADGKWLGIHWNAVGNNLGVWQNGQRHDWAKHAAMLYGNTTDTSPISAGWGQGRLEVKTKDNRFWCEVSAEGQVRFGNE
jgi:hypothetical protein